MKRLYLGAAAAIAVVSAAASANADPSISYVHNSLKQSVIERGPWTLHETDRYFQHNASGIVPPSSQKLRPIPGRGRPMRRIARQQANSRSTTARA